TALHILRILQEEAMKDNTAQIVAQVPVDVATFLLNEKRAEIHTIEARFKVNVLLVPNTYLETPNYKVTRLRHDDLNQGEPLPASFNMVEKPEEEDPVRQKKEEAKEPRQEAMVKGITTGTPAPMPVELGTEPTVQVNWLNRVLGWFRYKPAEPTPVPARAEPAREPRGRGRHERDRRGHRDERRDGPAHRDVQREAPRSGQRDERREPVRDDQSKDRQREPQRQRQPQGAQGQQARREPGKGAPRHDGRDGQRDPNRQRTPREPRAPQEARPEGEPAAVVQGAPGAPGGAAAGEGTRRRRDRRRGGRDRGERGESGERAEPRAAAHGHEGETGPAAAQAAPPAAPEPILTTHERSAPAPLADDDTPPSVWMPVVPEEPVETKAVEPSSALVSAEPAPSAPQSGQTFEHDASTAPAEAKGANGGDAAGKAPTPPVRTRSAPELPKVSLELPPDSDLVLIETAPERVPATEPAEPPPRPRRVRPTRAEAREEPLQLVETAPKDPTPPAA
ncbi:MAG: hypothetical protein ABI900_07470, partial [Betaproteobacteria bacterium]